MSPASSGPLEVEKYIGACLISQQRPKGRDFFARPPEPLFGYRPLVFAGPRREGPLSRLAVHAQGAPLILAKGCGRRKKKDQRRPDAADAASVASDESSGSANSDNCLPRIIKPRKRRKKDRKPRPDAGPDLDAPFGDEETPQLHHAFEDVEEAQGVDINGNETLCQCRYCDPAQIWDADRGRYSPFLTAPRSLFEGFLASYTPPECLTRGVAALALEDKKSGPRTPPGDLEVSTEIVTSPNGHRDIEIKFFSAASADSVRALRNRDGILTCVNTECADLG